jgi:type I restriction enzyme M protein
LFLHSFDSARIEWCDTLNSPLLVETGQTDEVHCVVANPPFSLDKWGEENAEVISTKPFLAAAIPQKQGRWAFISAT